MVLASQVLSYLQFYELQQQYKLYWSYNKFICLVMFHYEQQTDYKKAGTRHWRTLPYQEKDYAITGIFVQRLSDGTQVKRQLFANSKQIYLIENQQIILLELTLCVLEEHFWFLKKQKMYELQFKNKNTITKLSTNKIDTFITFYVHLAKYCILRSFPRHYKVKELLGEGTFSKVYNGQNVLSKQEVALKIFCKKNLANIPQSQSVIKNEIRTLRILKQYQLSPLIGVYETPDSIVLILQKAEAGNMIEYLKEHRSSYNQEFIRSIIYKVAENIYQLHKAGFIHRDIKPQNILFKNLTKGSSLFLGDFGMTLKENQVDDSTIGHAISGTFGFMAPEILNYQKYDKKSDIFSLGCLIYYLCSGKPLYSQTDMEYILRDNNKSLQRKISFFNDLNPQLYDLVAQLIKINPIQRLTAEQALAHQYFQSYQYQKPLIGEDDRTMRQYINLRISKYFM